MAEDEEEGRRALGEEGAAETGGAKAERLRVSDDELETVPKGAPLTSYTIPMGGASGTTTAEEGMIGSCRLRRKRGAGGVSTDRGRTTMVPAEVEARGVGG